ncbi:GTP cyclohydrolase, FolE2/MptA family [Staphylococcus epidermidis]|uniref:GTP cyclohydrolase, FolE2/MptA family n=1 Tax=Staphylococcus epidermidis TaxID=1282 RepID=UPI0037DA6A4A
MLYPILKPPHQKPLTQRPYQNPPFVQHLIRLIPPHLLQFHSIQRFHIQSPNQHSIHHHHPFPPLKYPK